LVHIIAGGPRTLPVSQDIEHGPEESRSESFNKGLGQVYDLGAMHWRHGLGPEAGLGPWVFRDRRMTGRRYRTAYNGEEPQQPPAPAPTPADLPIEKFQRGW
jgi:hypothetical protein